MIGWAKMLGTWLNDLYCVGFMSESSLFIVILWDMLVVGVRVMIESHVFLCSYFNNIVVC